MDEHNQHPPQHTKSNHGIPKGNYGDSKWETWLRIFLSFSLGAVSSAFFLGSKSRDISDLMAWKERAEIQLERMDRDGTNRSRWTDDNQQAEIETMRQRMNESEKASIAKSEVINVMQGKIERLESEINDLKTRDRK